jgi:hypothetical protein
MAVYTHREWLTTLSAALVEEYFGLIREAFSSQDPPDEENWISSSQAKDRCGLTPDQLQKAAERGTLHPEKRGRLLWYSRAELRRVYPTETHGLI